MRSARTLVVCLLLTGAMALPTASAQAADPNVAMVRVINDYRAKYGKRKLASRRTLYRSASGQSIWMDRSGCFCHRNRIYASRSFRALGETIAYYGGWRYQIRRTVGMWMRSSGHRRILLSTRYLYIGAGHRRGHHRGRRVTFWTVHVAR